MTGYWSRGLVSPVQDLADTVAEHGWVGTGSELVLDWPPERYRPAGTWLWKERPVWAVQDDFLDRAYLCARGADDGSPIAELAREGIVFDPDGLLERAAASTWWATHVETLYDLAVGCVDPRRADVADLWAERLRDDHPLVRSTACWVAPYLDAEPLAARLEQAADHDDDEQVRRRAAQAARVLRARG